MDPTSAVAPFKLVVIGASAGGLNALIELLTHMPPAFPLPVVVVQHLDPNRTSLLPSILDRRSTIHVKEADSGEVPRVGTVYVARPGRHLSIDSCGRLEFDTAPPMHFVRPSVDRLFTSAAEHLSPVIGVVLSGSGSDGATGAKAISNCGGVVIVEASAAFTGMPQAAIDTGLADYVVPLVEIPSLLVRLATAVHPNDRTA